MTKWTVSEMPSQKGRVAVVTGTGGLGYETALELARAGAEVVIAGRNFRNGAASVGKIQAKARTGKVRFEQLDLASLKSVEGFAARLKGQTGSIDLLINNAGVMVPPKRLETEDGFELQLGTNYLGHFALTAHLMPMLQKGRAARVVTVSSIAAGRGRMNFDDLQAKQAYDPFPVYAQSKLACLVFALEMHRRSEASGWGVTSLSAHPGLSRTNLLFNAPGQERISLERRFARLMFQSAAKGALPTLFAATSPQAAPGGYYGPNGPAELRGYPAPSRIPQAALDPETAERLWRVSEQLTGVSFASEAGRA
ncbi:MAG TPA: SDR family oxidoreductase [Hyphomonas sp.]|nr:short chain dehydrogenase [Hyphomonas sp.]HRJ01557.1 SDR family oxidoreductase [Hyphomonas sp.]HRK67490.1 SDR family oxidoreductase [Hyphomonas sp.]